MEKLRIAHFATFRPDTGNFGVDTRQTNWPENSGQIKPTREFRRIFG